MVRSYDDVITQVNEIFVEVFEIPLEKLTPQTTLFVELGLDSIDAIDLAMSFEKKFGVHVDQNLLTTIRTLDDVYQAVFSFQGQPATQVKSALHSA